MISIKDNFISRGFVIAKKLEETFYGKTSEQKIWTANDLSRGAL